MALINALVFVVLKILDNLVFVQESLEANNCRRKQTSKSAQAGIAFILDILSKKANVFAQICLVLEMKNVVGFIKTRFYWKQGCVTMCNYSILSK